MLLNAAKNFWGDESGAVTVDMVVVLGGSALMAMTVVQDVSRGINTVSEKLNAHLLEVGDDYLANPGAIYQNTGATPTSGTTPSTGAPGNPGNDKPVGNAGETPNSGNNGNGQTNWGYGVRGASE